MFVRLNGCYFEIMLNHTLYGDIWVYRQADRKTDRQTSVEFYSNLRNYWHPRIADMVYLGKDWLLSRVYDGLCFI